MARTSMMSITPGSPAATYSGRGRVEEDHVRCPGEPDRPEHATGGRVQRHQLTVVTRAKQPPAVDVELEPMRPGAWTS